MAVYLLLAPCLLLAPMVSPWSPLAPVVSRIVSSCLGCFFAVRSLFPVVSRGHPLAPVGPRGLPLAPVVSQTVNPKSMLLRVLCRQGVMMIMAMARVMTMMMMIHSFNSFRYGMAPHLLIVITMMTMMATP